MELMPRDVETLSEGVSETVYFKTRLERSAFISWMQGQGGEMFADWFAGMKKLKWTKCRTCKWFDPTREQCFDGHIQGTRPCSYHEPRGVRHEDIG